MLERRKIMDLITYKRLSPDIPTTSTRRHHTSGREYRFLADSVWMGTIFFPNFR